ncbi:MAG: transposase [Bdellovibrionaceae bacterium]|nr:transposase [Pseudobdellovibrionaceae bacterium]
MNNDNGSLPPKPQGVEVITSSQRRRRWTVEQKISMIKETYEPGENVSTVARKHGISASQLFTWKRQMEAGGLMAVKSEERVVPESELKAAQERIRRLERLLGQKTEEVEVLKEAVRIAREKKLISRKPLRGVEGFE